MKKTVIGLKLEYLLPTLIASVFSSNCQKSAVAKKRWKFRMPTHWLPQIPLDAL